MRLTRLEAEDFCLFADVALDLGNRGLVWVGGINKDSDSANSNGSGKSTLLKAIGWGFFGESIDGEDGDKVIRAGQKCATVRQWFEDGEDEWLVTRTRRKGQPRVQLKRTGDGEDWKGSRKEIQAKLNQMMGLDFEAFRNTVLYGQNDRKRFTAPATTDAERKSLLHGILRTSILAGCHEWAKAEHLKLKREGEDLESKIARLTARIAEHDIEALESRESAWADQVKERAGELAVQAREFMEKAKQASSQGDQAEDFQTRIDAMPEGDVEVAEGAQRVAYDARETARDAEREAQREVDKAEGVVGKREAALAQHDRELKRFAKDECPVCTSPITTGTTAGEYVDSLQSVRDMASESVREAQTDVTKLWDKLGAAGDAKTTALAAMGEAANDLSLEKNKEFLRGQLIDEMHELEAEAARAEEYIQAAKAKAQDARETQEAPSPYTEQLDDARTKVAKYRLKRKEHRTKLDEVTVERAHYQFWVRGFSNQGLPSFVLDAVMPYLTERTNHYLGILADGDITMTFSTQAELKSSKGEMRDKIHIGWEIEGVTEYPPSGGQHKKMEIACDLALMDMVATREGAHPDILMLDEILDGLDVEGRTRVTQLLHELRKTRETILVISHDDSIAEAFEHAVILVKEDGVTSIETRAAA